MKINEKNLAGFAMTNSTIDKDGWLLKKGEVNRSFQRRWFVLKGNLLFYFEKKTDKEPAGVIILEGCTIELAEYEEQYAFKIVFHGAGDRTYVLGADSQETMESWMKALACASYDYMKLMVSELQRQLDEIVELERAHESIFKEQQQENGSASGVPTPAPRVRRKAPPAPSSELALRAAVEKQQLQLSGSYRRALPSASHAQRINPFDRCQSEEDFGKSAKWSQPSSSAPGTPHLQRQNHGGSFKTYFENPHSHHPSLRIDESLQKAPPVNAVIRFKELHERLGKLIRIDVKNWSETAVAAAAPPVETTKVGELISFD